MGAFNYNRHILMQYYRRLRGRSIYDNRVLSGYVAWYLMIENSLQNVGLICLILEIGLRPYILRIDGSIMSK